MTIRDLRCDICGTSLAGSATVDPDNPHGATRLFVHPGDPLLREDGILICGRDWSDLRAHLGDEGRGGVCAVCGVEVTYEGSLHVLLMTGRIGEAPLWQLCREHGVDLLNRFRFTDPKLTPSDLALKADFPPR